MHGIQVGTLKARRLHRAQLNRDCAPFSASDEKHLALVRASRRGRSNSPVDAQTGGLQRTDCGGLVNRVLWPASWEHNREAGTPLLRTPYPPHLSLFPISCDWG